MPVTLPNGLVCPEKEDGNDASCQQIKDLFVAVDALQTIVSGNQNQAATKISQSISASNWTLVGPAKLCVYQQTLTVPAGITTSDMILSIYDSIDATLVELTVTILGPTTIRVESNSPITYTAVYA